MSMDCWNSELGGWIWRLRYCEMLEDITDL
jgi:hypothetical protein